MKNFYFYCFVLYLLAKFPSIEHTFILSDCFSYNRVEFFSIYLVLLILILLCILYQMNIIIRNKQSHKYFKIAHISIIVLSIFSLFIYHNPNNIHSNVLLNYEIRFPTSNREVFRIIFFIFVIFISDVLIPFFIRFIRQKKDKQ